LLPGEAAARRKIAGRVGRLFHAWGYSEVQTPTFEYLDTFKSCGQVSGSNFKFFDRNNNILMLRTELTAPIARLVATRMQGDASVKRLAYRSRVFRYEEAQAGRQCEFSQLGIEMMGAGGAAADAEVIALAAAALKETGLKKFSISMGHVEFINGLAEMAALGEKETQEVKRCLIVHDVVGLENVINASRVAGPLAEIFKALPFLHGGAELLEHLGRQMLSQRCRNTLDNLQEIYKLCKVYGAEKYLEFDLGLIRNFDYYTGMIFEGYTGGMGYPIIGGGRYDNLMAAFGAPGPATGFALGLDRVMLALERSGEVKPVDKFDVFVAYAEGGLELAIARSRELRGAGLSVKLASLPCEKKEAERVAEESCCLKLEYLEGGERV